MLPRMLMLMNIRSISFSAAMARRAVVFPVPGDPVNNMFIGGPGVSTTPLQEGHYPLRQHAVGYPGGAVLLYP